VAALFRATVFMKTDIDPSVSFVDTLQSFGEPPNSLIFSPNRSSPAATRTASLDRLDMESVVWRVPPTATTAAGPVAKAAARKSRRFMVMVCSCWS
jgi:hypothetical protein